MTDRFRGLLVTFETDVREDEEFIKAISLLRRVLNVKPVPSDIGSSISEDRVRHKLGEKLWKVIYPEHGEDK